MQKVVRPAQDSRKAMAAAGSRTREKQWIPWKFDGISGTKCRSLAQYITHKAHSPRNLRRLLLGTRTGYHSGDGRHWVRPHWLAASGQLGRTRGRLTPGDVSYPCASYHTTSDGRGNIGVGVMWGSRAWMVLGTSAGTRLALGGCLLWTPKAQLRGEVRVRGSANTPVRRLVKLVRQQQQKTRIRWRCWGSAIGNWPRWSGNLPVLLAPQPCCLGDIRTSRYRSLAQVKGALFQ